MLKRPGKRKQAATQVSPASLLATPPPSDDDGDGSCTSLTGAHSVLYVTYSASNLHLRVGSETYRKLRQIVSDFGVHRRRDHPMTPSYRLELLYQRTYSHEPFNCTLHAPTGAGCAEFTREEMKRAFGHDMALHRPKDMPRRLNVGFWVMALWMMRRERASSCDRGTFVWRLLGSA